ncbi:MAG: alanine dehydrogenase [Candidatus Omnitrophota bacterium]
MGKKKKTLVISEETVKEIITVKEAIREVEKGFKYFGSGRVEMPPKIYLYLSKYNGDFRAMPAYVAGMESCGIKWVNVHPGNIKKGLPAVMAMIILNDPADGYPLCVMNGTYITALRTGASGAIAAKYLARKDSENLAFIGCGTQAKAQFSAIKEVFRIKGVKLWDKRARAAAEFGKFIRRSGNFSVTIADTAASACADCDIIVTTTPSRSPLVKPEWLKKGVHINAVGADARGKQELSPEILKKARIVVDSWEQASHSGEINVPLRKKQLFRKNIYADIGEIVTGGKTGRKNNDEVTVFDSTGLAVQDMAIAYFIYKKAKKLNKGRYVEL